MSDDYADGTVHALIMGNSELRTILASAAQRRQLVLIDFSASWCGPCRMMLPVLQQLAAEHRGRLAVVKVDCEQTAANQDLAASSGIRAFPTFHLYRDQQKVAELRGADQAGLRRAIQQQLAQVGPTAGSAGGPSPMATALASALARVKAGCSFEEFVGAAKTLLTFVGNAINHPNEEKYRRVKLSNAAFQSKLACRAGGKECMEAIGFREMMEAGEGVMVMTELPPELPRVRQLLQQALQQAEAAAAGAAAAERRAAAAQPAAPAQAPPTGVAGAATSSTVDATVLARALVTAMGSSGSFDGRSGSAAGSGSSRPAAAPGQPTAPAGLPQHALAHVTPQKLARVLADIMRECGITGPNPAPAQQQQEEQQEAPPPGPPEE